MYLRVGRVDTKIPDVDYIQYEELGKLNPANFVEMSSRQPQFQNQHQHQQCSFCGIG
jgi:hypothetical protein